MWFYSSFSLPSLRPNWLRNERELKELRESMKRFVILSLLCGKMFWLIYSLCYLYSYLLLLWMMIGRMINRKDLTLHNSSCVLKWKLPSVVRGILLFCVNKKLDWYSGSFSPCLWKWQKPKLWPFKIVLIAILLFLQDCCKDSRTGKWIGRNRKQGWGSRRVSLVLVSF